MTVMLRDLSDDEARAALPLKWEDVGPGVIPAWIAEMDLALAPVVSEAVLDAVRRGATGYPPHGDAGIGPAFAGFATRHWGWTPPEDAVVVTGDVIGAIALALQVLCPPGPIVVPLPCYPPFRDVVQVVGRELVTITTDPDADDTALDLEALDRAFAAGARTLLLCNPHNPLGRVPTRAELAAVRDLAARHGARVISDEIHGPLTLPGATFTPYLSVDPAGIVVTSASKAFNTAGLHCAFVMVLDAEERTRLRGVPLPMNHAYSGLGMIAGRTAYAEGDPWLAALVERLDRQRSLLETLLADLLPAARMRRLEATYLPWLDLRAYGVADPAAVGLAHGVRCAPGQNFQPGLDGHVRINLATTPARLTTMVERLAATVGAPSS